MNQYKKDESDSPLNADHRIPPKLASLISSVLKYLEATEKEADREERLHP